MGEWDGWSVCVRGFLEGKDTRKGGSKLIRIVERCVMAAGKRVCVCVCACTCVHRERVMYSVAFKAKPKQ